MSIIVAMDTPSFHVILDIPIDAMYQAEQSDKTLLYSATILRLSPPTFQNDALTIAIPAINQSNPCVSVAFQLVLLDILV